VREILSVQDWVWDQGGKSAEGFRFNSEKFREGGAREARLLTNKQFGSCGRGGTDKEKKGTSDCQCERAIWGGGGMTE